MSTDSTVKVESYRSHNGVTESTIHHRLLINHKQHSGAAGRDRVVFSFRRFLSHVQARVELFSLSELIKYLRSQVRVCCSSVNLASLCLFVLSLQCCSSFISSFRGLRRKTSG